MSEQTTPVYTGSGGQLKTLAVRITEDLRPQLDIIAQLTGRSATEATTAPSSWPTCTSAASP